MEKTQLSIPEKLLIGLIFCLSSILAGACYIMILLYTITSLGLIFNWDNTVFMGSGTQDIPLGIEIIIFITCLFFLVVIPVGATIWIRDYKREKMNR